MQKWLDSLKERARHSYVPPLTFAELYARLGDREQALAWLERAFNARSPNLVWLKVEPRWEAFRGEAGFQRLLQGLHLAP